MNAKTPIVMEEIVSDGSDIAGTSNKYFVIISPNLKIYLKETFETGGDEINHSTFKALIKFKYNPRTKLMKSKKNSNYRFSFVTIS